MNLVEGAKVLTALIAQRGGEPVEVPAVEHSIPIGALPLFRWVGVAPPASDEADR
jgi:hypothetical protein